MRWMRSLLLPPLAAVTLSAGLAVSASAYADTVGTAGAVNTTSSGTPPGGGARVIEIGTQVVENEKIQTTATGSVQVLFIDKTTLNVGPNSTLVIDRFVYNPATTRGQLALSLGKGVLRVVGGAATHSEGATIRTPVAAIGLRGGIAIISHSGAKGTEAILGFGRMSVSTLCWLGGQLPSEHGRSDATGLRRDRRGTQQSALLALPRQQPGARPVERPVDQPGRPKRRGEPATDGRSGPQLQRRNAQFAWRPDCDHDVLGGSRQCARDRPGDPADCPARVAEHSLGKNHAEDCPAGPA